MISNFVVIFVVFFSVNAFSEPCVAYIDKADISLNCRGSNSAFGFDSDIKVNDIQVLGTHNSYKRQLVPEEQILFKKWHPQYHRAITYDHPSIRDQLAAGVRYLELDIYRDPDGSRFDSPIIAQLADTNLPEDYKTRMTKPGLKVLHIKDQDYGSHCLAFSECLLQIRQWSDAHPDHIPLFILIEAKEWLFYPEEVSTYQEFVAELNFDNAALQAIDQSILKIFSRNKVIAPGDVVGKFESLRSMARADAWPSLAESRGQIIFLLLESEVAVKYGQDSVVDRYVGGRSYDDMLLFPLLKNDKSPHSAFVNLYRKDLDELSDVIKKHSESGYIIRARADLNTVEARQGSTSRRDAVLAGANIVVTDFVWPHPNFGHNYFVNIHDKAAARCTPLKAKLCVGE